MAIVLVEKADSRQRTSKWNAETGFEHAVTLFFILTGTSDDEAALNHVLSYSPATQGELVRNHIRLEPAWVDTVNDDGQWNVTIDYGAYGLSVRPPTGSSSFAFDTTGGTQHITQSLATRNRYAPPGQTAPNFRGAIGVSHEAVEGVDITVPVYSFSETHYLASEVVTQAYKGTLFSLTGKVNDAPFKGLAAGECLFLGASGSKRGEGDWEITFKFAGSPNRSGIVIGDITGITKRGWDYLWVRYADSEDADAKTVVKKPVAVYVERVYEEADFAALGIGT